MRMSYALAGLLLMTAPALATPCADEITTLEKRLDSAGAAQVTGTVPPGGPSPSVGGRPGGCPAPATAGRRPSPWPS